MNEELDRIDQLDISLFDGIESQTSPGDRRSLLALQRLTAKRCGTYRYLEIGSYLGGSIQPHLVDNRCIKIYSIDPRPTQQPDERKNYTAGYPCITTADMLDRLRSIRDGAVGKIVCIENSAHKVDKKQIDEKVDLLFIDGEHTDKAVMQDYRFCYQVQHSDAIIAFHDFSVVQKGIREICKYLRATNVDHLSFKLEDEVFAIFFSPDCIIGDPYLEALYKTNKNILCYYPLKRWFRRRVPAPVRKFLIKIKHRMIRS